MLPVCSASSAHSSNALILFNGSWQSPSPFRKDFESRWIDLGLANDSHLHRVSIKAQASKSLYSSYVQSNGESVTVDITNNFSSSNNLDNIKCKLSDVWSSPVRVKYVDNPSESAVGGGLLDFTELTIPNTDNVMESVEPESMSAVELTPENPSLVSNSLDMDESSISNVKSSLDDFLAGASESFNSSINKGQSALNSSLDTLTSSMTSMTKGVSKSVDDVIANVFSTVDQTGELTGNKLANFSSDLKDATSKANVVALDLLRHLIVAVEDSLQNGVSFAVYSYGNAKELLLPPEIRDALNLSEDRVIAILKPLGSAFQQVSVAVEGLERNVGLDPNDPVVPFALFLSSSATLWVFYRVWTYGGYSGDLSPKSTFELLTGKENAVLIDIRPEVMRERDGVPDLRRNARFRYASAYLPEVDGTIRKILKGGKELDDTLNAAVIRNLKIVQDRSKVIVMDTDGTCSKGIARALRKLGIKRSYLVQGGFRSWVKEGLRTKELKPETTLTILNEDAEAILEDINPSPLQALGVGVGFVAALYGLLEWEKTLQFIGVVGLGQSVYRRLATYENTEDLRRDVRLLLSPVRVGAQAFSWVAGKLETNGIGLPTSPSSVEVQNRVLQAAAKHESQPSDSEGGQDPSSESMTPRNDNADLSEA